MKRGRRVLGAFVVVWALAYVGFGLLLYALQERMVFPCTWMYDDVSVGAVPAGVQSHTLASGRSLWSFGEAPRAVLLLHGNGEWIGGVAPAYAPLLLEHGWRLVALEYPGVAGSPGSPLDPGALAQDVADALDHLASLGIPPHRVVVHGRSIGGGVAGLALPGIAPAGLVLESSFDSLLATAASRPLVGWYPLSWLLFDPMDTQAALRGRDLPVFQVHDETDALIHVQQADALAAQLRDAEVVRTQGFPHGAPLVLEDPVAREAWIQWLDEVVPPSAPPG